MIILGRQKDFCYRYGCVGLVGVCVCVGGGGGGVEGGGKGWAG